MEDLNGVLASHRGSVYRVASGLCSHSTASYPPMPDTDEPGALLLLHPWRHT